MPVGKKHKPLIDDLVLDALSYFPGMAGPQVTGDLDSLRSNYVWPFSKQTFGLPQWTRYPFDYLESKLGTHTQDVAVTDTYRWMRVSMLDIE